MIEYKASGKAPITGVLIGILLSLLSGLVVGWILYQITHLLKVSLIIIFPLVAGAIAGFGVSAAVKTGKIRNGLIAALLGLVAGTTITVTDHYLGYQSFKSEVRQTLEVNGATVSDQDVAVATDLFLQQSVGKTGFLGFIDLEIKGGVSIGRASSQGVNTGSIGAQILFFIEWMLMAFAATALGYAAAKEPFDEQSEQWYAEGTRLVSIPLFNQQEVLDNLKARNYAQVGQLGQLEAVPHDRVDILIRNTPDKKARDLILEVHAFVTDKKGKQSSNTLRTGLVSRESVRAILEAAKAIVQNPNATPDQDAAIA